jgi:hypothetical protein|tara:strand:+ start:230 stop:466 length:237 start_codon:yes stop_codon:yes gene_type:complete
MHRIIATCDGNNVPVSVHGVCRRSVFATGPFVRAEHGKGVFLCEEDRRRGAFTGRGWPASMAYRMVLAAKAIHRGESP